MRRECEITTGKVQANYDAQKKKWYAEYDKQINEFD